MVLITCQIWIMTYLEKIIQELIIKRRAGEKKNVGDKK